MLSFDRQWENISFREEIAEVLRDIDTSFCRIYAWETDKVCSLLSEMGPGSTEKTHKKTNFSSISQFRKHICFSKVAWR